MIFRGVFRAVCFELNYVVLYFGVLIIKFGLGIGNIQFVPGLVWLLFLALFFLFIINFYEEGS